LFKKFYEFRAAQILEILDLWKKVQDYMSHSAKWKRWLSICYVCSTTWKQEKDTKTV